MTKSITKPGAIKPPVWQWVEPLPCYSPASPCGVLAINGRNYWVEPIVEDVRRGKLTVLGYRLTNDQGDGYDIDLRCQTCDCADAQFRQRPCKHLLALRDAMKELPAARAAVEAQVARDLEEQAERQEQAERLETLLAWVGRTLPTLGLTRREQAEPLVRLLVDWAQTTLAEADVPCACGPVPCLRCRTAAVLADYEAWQAAK